MPLLWRPQGFGRYRRPIICPCTSFADATEDAGGSVAANGKFSTVSQSCCRGRPPQSQGNAGAVLIHLRRPPKDCIFRSDRGSRYCAYDFQKKLQAHKPIPSMSAKRNCYDNAAVETVFKSLKAEMLWRQNWPNRRQAEAAIFQSINGLYNPRRRHSYPGGISLLAFEAKAALSNR